MHDGIQQTQRHKNYIEHKLVKLKHVLLIISKMSTKVSSILFFLLLLFACNSETNNNTKKNSTKVNIKTINSDKLKEIDCDELINKLIKSSDGYAKIIKESRSFLDVKKINISVDEATSSFIRVLVSFTNKDEREAPLAWIMVDLEKDELNDVTIDPEEPVKLKFDKEILNQLKNNCKDFKR